MRGQTQRFRWVTPSIAKESEPFGGEFAIFLNAAGCQVFGAELAILKRSVSRLVGEIEEMYRAPIGHTPVAPAIPLADCRNHLRWPSRYKSAPR
jgi:hypothetical protein